MKFIKVFFNGLFRGAAGAVVYPPIRVAAAVPRLIGLLEATLIKYPTQQILISMLKLNRVI